jgi:hypothetical protein
LTSLEERPAADVAGSPLAGAPQDPRERSLIHNRGDRRSAKSLIRALFFYKDVL